MTRDQILTAALEEIKNAGCPGQICQYHRSCPEDVARAALEAAEKAPCLADDEAMHSIAMDVVARYVNIGDNSRKTIVDAVLCAVDAYQRGGK